MRILFFITDITKAGGTERITLSLAEQLVKKGYEVTILSLMGNSVPFYEWNKSIKLMSVFPVKKSLYLFYPIIVFKLFRIIRKHKIDIVIDVVTSMSLFSIPASSLTRAKVITWEHFNFDINLGKMAMDMGRKVAAKYASAIVTLTASDLIEYKERLKCNAEVLTIPNFLNDYPASVSSCNNTVAIAVGRLTYQKGFDKLINVWALFKQNPESKPWKLRIIGDGEDKDKLNRQIEELGIGNSIEIVPATKNIEEEYLSASLFLMTSRWEGLPMVLIESQAFGLPMISYNCKTGPAEVISNEYNGLLIENDRPDLFLKALRKLTTNKNLIGQLGANARANSLRYREDNVVPLWIELFKKVRR